MFCRRKRPALVVSCRVLASIVAHPSDRERAKVVRTMLARATPTDEQTFERHLLVLRIHSLALQVFGHRILSCKLQLVATANLLHPCALLLSFSFACSTSGERRAASKCKLASDLVDVCVASPELSRLESENFIVIVSFFKSKSKLKKCRRFARCPALESRRRRQCSFST